MFYRKISVWSIYSYDVICVGKEWLIRQYQNTICSSLIGRQFQVGIGHQHPNEEFAFTERNFTWSISKYSIFNLKGWLIRQVFFDLSKIGSFMDLEAVFRLRSESYKILSPNKSFSPKENNLIRMFTRHYVLCNPH